ncbi:MAG: TonB-dependent receptor [Methyloglobulus sp.]|nr:TonB-dependent receptor [Methyloglobulus sp.]
MPFLLFVLLQSLSAVAVAEDNSPRQYNIPPQPLAAALQAFSDSSHLQLLYDANLVAGLTSPAVRGAYTPQQALAQLLGQSGLSYQIKSARMVTLTKRTGKDSGVNADGNLLPVVQVTAKADDNAGGDTTLPKVTVEADSAYDPEYYADPYNKDYVLPNATVGTKTDTPIMETPLNVQVISKQVLKDQQVIRLSDALKNVSGVLSNSTGISNPSSFGAQSLFLRGFQSETFFRNGFRMQEGSASRGMANVESVEVLKGAAAILYGLVEPGGMVNVVTKQPLSTPYYGFTQQFGSYDLYRTTLDASGPLTNNKDLLYRANLSYENSGSFRDFVNKEDVFFAPVLKWVISPQTQATFELEYNHQHSGFDYGFIPGKGNTLLNVPINRNYAEYSPLTTETIFGGFNWSHKFNEDWSIKHRFSVNHLRSDISRLVTPNQFDDESVQRFLLSTNNTKHNTYSTNLDLTGKFNTFGLKHTLLLGGDYYRLDTKFLQAANYDALSSIDILNPIHPGSPFLNTTTTPVLDESRGTDQYGLYIQDQIELPYKVHVMGGIRYQNIHSTTLSKNFDGSAPSLSASTNDAVTPRVGILWQPKSWLSLYANYVESFGANFGRQFISPTESKAVPPTSAEQYEGGIKTEFFDGRLRATLAYYDLTKTNIATDDRLHPGFVIVTGAARSRGPELDIQGEILPGWNIIATYSNIDARVTKTNDTSGFSPFVGDRMFNVPRNTGSVWSTYEVQDGDFKGIKLGGGVTLRDSQEGCCDKFRTSIPGYATVDLLAGYSRKIGDATVSAQLNVNNLLDKRYYSGISTYHDFGLRGGYVDFGQPRTFMGQISVQY